MNVWSHLSGGLWWSTSECVQRNSTATQTAQGELVLLKATLICFAKLYYTCCAGNFELLSKLLLVPSFCRSFVRSWSVRPWTWSRKSQRSSTMTSSGRSSAPTSSWELLRITPTELAWPSCSASRPPTARLCCLVWSSMWRGWRRSKTKSTSWLEPPGRRCLNVFTFNHVY